MLGKSRKTKVTLSTPERAQGRVGRLFHGGVTLIDRRSGDAEIIIDSGLAAELQRAYLEHEQVQLRVIRDEISRYGAGVMPAAHFEGLRAGIKKARELGVEEEYKRHRGER